MSIESKIKKIQNIISELPPVITVYYKDGSIKSLNNIDAVKEIVENGKAVEKVTTGGGKGQGRLGEIIQAVAELETE